MVFDILIFVVGVVTGAAYMSERHQHRQEKTLAEVDADIRAQLQLYKNLSESLTEDVKYLRKKLHVSKEQK